MLKKLINFHSASLHSDLSSCSTCNKIIAKPDLNHHLFITFKEYKDDADNFSLKYCSENFINIIVTYEKYFLFYYKYYSHEIGFGDILYEALKNNAPHPEFCCKEILEYFLKFFMKCRIYNSVNFMNNKFSNKSEFDKIKKILHL